jgi:hypothetical protein
MRFNQKYYIYLIVIFISVSCLPVEKIARHDLQSGFYTLKTEDKKLTDVYLSYNEDTIRVYSVVRNGNVNSGEIRFMSQSSIRNIVPGSYFYKSTFTNKTPDIDLSTIIMKYRPEREGVPNQLNANINAAMYVGYRKNFYKVMTETSPLNERSSYIRQIAFDAGLFVGIGITPVNPTVTGNRIPLEYDGIVFQKGIAAFLTFDNMSVGLSLGFDNLLDKNKTVWIYNQKPYLGLMIGISNF